MSLCAVCVCCCWPVFKQERFHFRFQTFYVQFWESEERKLVRVIHWYITPRETNKYIRMGNFPSTKRSPGLDGDTVWCPAIADGIIMGSKRKDKKHRRGKSKNLFSETSWPGSRYIIDTSRWVKREYCFLQSRACSLLLSSRCGITPPDYQSIPPTQQPLRRNINLYIFTAYVYM